MKKNLITIFLTITGFAAVTSTHATTGYFMHAYGVKAQGVAGTSTAFFQDSLTIATNPAGLSWVNQGIDIGATVFAPDRSSEIVGSPIANGQYDANGREYFVLPELGINHQINDRVNLGFAIYGNGGMNTKYDQNPYAGFGNQGVAGVDLTQVFISPSVAWRYAENQSIGIATNFLYQRFEAKGISGFAVLSQSPNQLSNRGKDSSTGIGVKVGWAGQFLNDQLTLGAKYSSKIEADKFDQYSGLFAEQGGFDVPESYGIGAALKLTPKLTVAADLERINYSDVASVGNNLTLNQPFGNDQGAGFGWQDINVYRLGLSYQALPKLILRAGYSRNDQPVKSDQTFLNILAPGVVQDHLSLGATWNVDERQAVTVAYTHALEKEVKGNQSIPVAFGGGEANLKMSQNILGVAYHYAY